MTTPPVMTGTLAALIYRTLAGGYTPSTQESRALADWEHACRMGRAKMGADDRAWFARLDAAYQTAAAEMRADGWQQHPHPNIYRAAKGHEVFTKGDRAAILVRDFGRPNWHPVPSAQKPDRCLIGFWRDADPPTVAQ